MPKRIEYTVTAKDFDSVQWTKTVYCRTMRDASKTAMNFVREGYCMVNIYVRDMSKIKRQQEDKEFLWI